MGRGDSSAEQYLYFGLCQRVAFRKARESAVFCASSALKNAIAKTPEEAQDDNVIARALM